MTGFFCLGRTSPNTCTTANPTTAATCKSACPTTTCGANKRGTVDTTSRSSQHFATTTHCDPPKQRSCTTITPTTGPSTTPSSADCRSGRTTRSSKYGYRSERNRTTWDDRTNICWSRFHILSCACFAFTQFGNTCECGKFTPNTIRTNDPAIASARECCAPSDSQRTLLPRLYTRANTFGAAVADDGKLLQYID